MTYCEVLVYEMAVAIREAMRERRERGRKELPTHKITIRRRGGRLTAVRRAV